MSGFTSPRLLPANTTLLQPGSKFFRVSDALNYAAQATQAQTTSLQAQIDNLQNQINTINARLAAANIP